MASRPDRAELLSRMRAEGPLVQPALLLCDFGNLEAEIAAVEAAGAASLHLDVMDGHFVPNITYGPLMVEAVRSRTQLLLDVHLMITDPLRYAQQFYDAGADMMTIHAEAVDDPRPTLEAIRSMGAVAGLAVSPPTPVSAIEQSLPLCDVVLAMSVMPGFGGQRFDDTAIGKLRSLSARSDVNVLLQVDGGIDARTIGPCAAAGCWLFVAGSSVFRSDDYGRAIGEMNRQIALAREQAQRN